MILIIKTNKHPLHDEEFVKPVIKVIDDKVDVVEIKEENLKEKIKKADKIIITGTSLRDNSYMKHWRNTEIIKQLSVPVLGICAGMQILGKIYGSKIVKSTQIGVKEIKIERETKLISKKGQKLKAYFLHNYTIKENEKMKIIGRLDYPEIIKIKYKEQYGLGFNPEVMNREIIERFLEI